MKNWQGILSNTLIVSYLGMRLHCFQTRYGVGVRSMKNLQGIPTTPLTLGGEVMVRRNNSTLAFSTELLNYIIAFVTQGKSGNYKIFDG